MCEKRTTRLGTPCAPVWDDAWIERINNGERLLNRRICGARTLDDTPCTLQPNHANGRCRYHGGFDCTGAQPGNRNAVLHGLYARGLQRCGRHCPMWNHCPVPRAVPSPALAAVLAPIPDLAPSDPPAPPDLSPSRIPARAQLAVRQATSPAGQTVPPLAALPDIDGLSPHQAPVCPYETIQYQLAVTDLLEGISNTGPNTGTYRHLAHQTALLGVMVNRAAAAMAVSPLTEAAEMTSDTAHSFDPHPAAALVAFQRLSSELRRCLDLLTKLKPQHGGVEAVAADMARRRIDSEITPEYQADLHHTPDGGERLAREEVAKALRDTRRDFLRDAMKAYERAFAYYPPMRGQCENDADHRNALIQLFPERYPGEMPRKQKRPKDRKPQATPGNRTLADVILASLDRTPKNGD